MSPSEMKFFEGAFHVLPKELPVSQQLEQQQMQARAEQVKEVHPDTPRDLSTRATILMDLDRPPAFFSSSDSDWLPDPDSGKYTSGPSYT